MMSFDSIRTCICDTVDWFLLYIQFGPVPLKEFKDSCRKVTHSRNNGAINDEDFLTFYGLFKQAKFGDCNDESVPLTDEQNLKRKAWMKLRGLSKKDAMIKYINLANKLLYDYKDDMETSLAVHTRAFFIDSKEPFEYDDFFDLVVDGECKKVTETLLKNPKLVNVKSPEGLTALHLAADRGNLDMVKCLIEHGSDLDAVDDNGDSPLHVAIESQEDDVVQFLVEAGANTKLKNSEGISAEDLINLSYI